MTEHNAMNDDELIAAITYEVSAADYEGQSLISEQRSEADLAYTSQFTDGTYPSTGMSSIIINTLQPAVDTLTTYLTKMFCSDKETVVFSGDNAELMSSVTSVVNNVIHKDNNGYEILNRWIKDAALHKNGIVKVVWDDTPEYHKEEFEGTDEELNVHISTLEGEGYDVEISEKKKEKEILEITDDVTGESIEITEEYMSVTLRVSKPRNMPKIINIPPEEFLINEGATGINNDQLTRFVAHRQLVYVSDILQMFPDVKEEDLAGGIASGYLEHEYETDTRHFFDGTYDQNDYESTQPLLRQVELTESWIRADRDGDGFSEWRHVFNCGRTLLFDEEWFGPIPMCSFTFFPIPHKFYGLGIWDKLRDYHRTKTGLLRSTLDSATQRNVFRLIADPRMINLRDLKSNRPGIIGALPGFDPKSVMPLPVPASAGGEISQILQYLDKEVIAQIGIDPVTGLVSADIEKSGNDAAKTSQTIDNASAKVETFGREFAETGLKDMIWIIYDLMVQNGRMRDFGLSKKDLKAKVGLGHQTMQQKMAGAQAIMQAQTAMESSPVAPVAIPAKNKLMAATEMAKALGFENAELFFPTVEEVEAERQAQAQQAAAQLERDQNLQAAQLQQSMDDSDSTRRLEDAKAKEAEIRANAAERKQQLEEEAKVVEIENIKEDNELNKRRQEAQEEQMVANLDMQKERLDYDYYKSDLDAETSIKLNRNTAIE